MKVRVTKKLSDAPIEIPIHTEFIKLQDFLKFANAICQPQLQLRTLFIGK